MEYRAKRQGREQNCGQQGVERPSRGCGRLQSAWLVNKGRIGAGHSTSLKWLLGLKISEVSRARPAVDDEISSEDEAAAKICADHLWQTHKTVECSIIHIEANPFKNTQKDQSVHKTTETCFGNTASIIVESQVLFCSRLAFLHGSCIFLSVLLFERGLVRNNNNTTSAAHRLLNARSKKAAEERKTGSVMWQSRGTCCWPSA